MESEKKKIVISYIHYPMAIAKYFEFALRRRDDVEVISVGPYTRQWIPWNGGMDLSLKYASSPDIVIPGQIRGFQSIPIGFVENQLPWQPDMWLQIDAGWHMIGKPNNGENVFVATDPHVLQYGVQHQYADRFYSMQTPYMSKDDLYLPYAYDPIYHSKIEVGQEHDVCLIGLQYPNRNILVNELRNRGVNVFYELGMVYDEAQQKICSAPIGINWSSLQDLTARVFELLGMGRLAIVNDVPDLSRFFEHQKDLIVFNGKNDGVEQIMKYLSDKSALDEIANNGHKSVKEHTWDSRIDTILKGVGYDY